MNILKRHIRSRKISQNPFRVTTFFTTLFTTFRVWIMRHKKSEKKDL